MDFAPDQDQADLVAAIGAMLARHAEIPITARREAAYFDAALQAALDAGGFLDAAAELGPLGAALVVLETARSPACVETGFSAMVAPLGLGATRIDGPLALLDGPTSGRAFRFATVARNIIVLDRGEAWLVPVEADAIEPVKSILAYPFGRFARPPALDRATRYPIGSSAGLTAWRRVALALEIAGAARSAVDFTVDFVKERRLFGRTVGSFQAVQHRLAQCHQIADGVKYLALRAAWSGEGRDAAYAAVYAQTHIGRLVHDLHQFHGAMGVTNEHRLHLWTYRLRALQAEVGGAHAAALDLADALWGPSEDAA